MRNQSNVVKVVAAWSLSMAIAGAARGDAPAVAAPPALAVSDPPLDPPPRFTHVPPSNAPADSALLLSATIVAPHKLAEVTLHHRFAGETEYRRVPFALSRSGVYTAQIPAAELPAGVLEYYIGSTSAADPHAAEVLRFASPAFPHPVIVEGSEVRWRRELLAAHRGNRSRFNLDGEYVDFGARTRDAGTSSYRDYYYRLELDYTYRMLARVYSIRIGVGLLRGDTYVRDSDGLERTPSLPVGETYGFAEVRFRVARRIRLNLRGTLGAGPRKFDGGAGGELLFGFDPGTHFAIGGDYMTTLGFRTWFRLAWNTVPRVPMSFTAEATNLPLGGDVGGRVFLSASYNVNRYFGLNAHAGYAFRDFHLGGPVAGLACVLEF